MFDIRSVLSRVRDETWGRCSAFWLFLCPVQRRLLIVAWAALGSLLVTRVFDHWLSHMVFGSVFTACFLWCMNISKMVREELDEAHRVKFEVEMTLQESESG